MRNSALEILFHTNHALSLSVTRTILSQTITLCSLWIWKNPVQAWNRSRAFFYRNILQRSISQREINRGRVFYRQQSTAAARMNLSTGERKLAVALRAFGSPSETRPLRERAIGRADEFRTFATLLNHEANHATRGKCGACPRLNLCRNKFPNRGRRAFVYLLIANTSGTS